MRPPDEPLSSCLAVVPWVRRLPLSKVERVVVYSVIRTSFFVCRDPSGAAVDGGMKRTRRTRGERVSPAPPTLPGRLLSAFGGARVTARPPYYKRTLALRAQEKSARAKGLLRDILLCGITFTLGPRWVASSRSPRAPTQFNKGRSRHGQLLKGVCGFHRAGLARCDRAVPAKPFEEESSRGLPRTSCHASDHSSSPR